MLRCDAPRCPRDAVTRLTATHPTLSAVYIGACQPDGRLVLNLCDEHRLAFGKRRPSLTLPDGLVVPFLARSL